MTNERSHTALPGPALVAADLLDTVMAQVGVDGLCAALAEPGLMAAVDQHATAVREALRHAGYPVTATALAGYARSVLAAAQRMGLWLPRPAAAGTPDLDWARAPWHIMRLVGICALADERGLLLPA